MKITTTIPDFVMFPEFTTKLYDLISDYKHAKDIQHVDIYNVVVHYNGLSKVWIYTVIFIIDGVYVELQHLSLKNLLLHADNCDLREIIYEVTCNKINDLIDKIDNPDSQ